MLLVGGLIAFLVARNRRRNTGESNNGAALQAVRDVRDVGAAPHRTNYDSLALSAPENNYAAVSPPPNYDAWTTKDDNRNVYEHGDVTKFG